MYNVNLGKKEKISRIYKMHANHKDRVEEARAGAIVGIIGLKETSTGHTLTQSKPILLEPIEIYQPVISVAVEAARNVDQDKLILALQRITQEDPTFIMKTDEDAYQTIVSGMGELHLDVIMHRVREEFGIDVHVGKPQVVYKESIESEISREHSFEKVINNVPCKGWVSLKITPNKRGEGNVIVSRITEENPVFPFVNAIEEGIAEASSIGVLKGYPLTDVRVEINNATFNNPEFARLTLKMAAYDCFS